jgi:hypothetical protein
MIFVAYSPDDGQRVLMVGSPSNNGSIVAIYRVVSSADVKSLFAKERP